MSPLLLVHIVAGSAGIVTGFIALHAAKGATLHRRMGMVFVVVMLTMTTTGAVIAAAGGHAPALNIPAALTTTYLVVTGFATVRPPARRARALALAGMIVALGTGLCVLAFGIEAVALGGTRKGMPAFPFFLFAAIGIFGTIGDLRMMRSGSLRAPSRIARHLWRMSLALFVATMSFFLGQADVIPKPIRIMPLLVAPPLSVLVTMVWWLWRVRFRRPRPGTVAAVAPDAA